jgi:hypothetical protein
MKTQRLAPTSALLLTAVGCRDHAQSPTELTGTSPRGTISTTTWLSLTLVVSVLALSSCDIPSAPEGRQGALDVQTGNLLATSNTWVTKRPLSKARRAIKAATLNQLIYVIGGGDPTFQSVLRRVEDLRSRDQYLDATAWASQR